MSKPILYSGQAVIAADTIARCRGVVAVLRYDLAQNFTATPAARRLEVYERIDRYLKQADEIEVELKKFLAVSA